MAKTEAHCRWLEVSQRKRRLQATAGVRSVKLRAFLKTARASYTSGRKVDCVEEKVFSKVTKKLDVGIFLAPVVYHFVTQIHLSCNTSVLRQLRSSFLFFIRKSARHGVRRHSRLRHGHRRLYLLGHCQQAPLIGWWQISVQTPFFRSFPPITNLLLYAHTILFSTLLNTLATTVLQSHHYHFPTPCCDSLVALGYLWFQLLLYLAVLLSAHTIQNGPKGKEDWSHIAIEKTPTAWHVTENRYPAVALPKSHKYHKVQNERERRGRQMRWGKEKVFQSHTSLLYWSQLCYCPSISPQKEQSFH